MRGGHIDNPLLGPHYAAAHNIFRVPKQFHNLADENGAGLAGESRF